MCRVRLHESEERFGFAELSLANQAAAFERISRSSLSWRFSRRNRLSSARSSVVSPPSPRPASRASCLTHSAIDQGVGPNSRDNSRGLRPARTSSTILRRNSGAYRFCLLAIADSSIPNIEVSTEAGQVHSFRCPCLSKWVLHANARVFVPLLDLKG